MSGLIIALLVSQSFMAQTTLPQSDKDRCFIESLCNLKESIRWRTPKWDSAMCARVGNAVIRAEKETKIPRELSMSIMLNESDMNDLASRATIKNGKTVAVDGGLMGNRCRLDDEGKYCINYRKSLKVTPKALLNPEVSINLATQKLAAIRDRDSCPHRDHPWFAHYNWGNKTFKKGIPLYYPQKIAFVWKAWGDALGSDTSFLYNLRISVERGKKPFNINVPNGQRYKDFVAKVKRCSVCVTALQSVAVR